MAVSLLHLLVTTTAVACIAKAAKECPPWFEWVNTSDSSRYCACPSQVPDFIYCDERNQRTSISQGSCIFYNPKEDITRGSWCSFFFPAHATKNGMFTLPENVSELNSVVCGNLSREVKGPLCGRCTNRTGPSVSSIGIECVSCSPINILYYLLLQYFPSTVTAILVIILRPNITSAPMANYVLFCNAVVLYCRFNTWLFVKPYSITSHLAKAALTLSAIWSFDALLFISPHLCVSHHMEEFYIPFLEFVATVYPFVLLLLTYAVIEMHTKNFGPIVKMWRLVRRPYVQVYRAWDPTSSMIKAFASLSYLSFAKLSYLIWESCLVDDIFSGMAVFFFLPPVLILVVYPTSLYRKISHWISPKWRLRIKTYVEIFNGSFKNGTNGTRDYRCLCGWGLLILGVFPQLLVSIVTFINHQQTNKFMGSSIIAIFLLAVASLCIWLQPYKQKHSNDLTAGLLLILSFVATNMAGHLNSQETDIADGLTTLFLLVPHTVLWGYVIWRGVKNVSSCWRCHNSETRRLLYEGATSPP